MGMFVAATIQDIEEVVNVLKFMVDSETYPEPAHPSHPFFQTSRWSWMFRSNSFYFVPRSIQLFERDDISNNWVLIVRCDLKNYENEIEKFIDWITPYVDMGPDQMFAYSRYEETKEPTIYYTGGRYDATDS